MVAGDRCETSSRLHPSHGRRNRADVLSQHHRYAHDMSPSRVGKPVATRPRRHSLDRYEELLTRVSPRGSPRGAGLSGTARRGGGGGGAERAGGAGEGGRGAMGRLRPTSADVAARAGVSRTTVSFVLNYR